MDIKYTSELHRYMAAVESLVESTGLSVTIETNLYNYRKFRNEQVDRYKLSTLFDVSQTYMTPNSAFWVKCVNTDGDIVHSQAFKVYDMGDQSLNSHITSSRLMYLPPQLVGLDEATVDLPENTNSLSGTVAYHGEFWTHKSLRLSEINLIIGRYGLVAAKLFWDFDYCFAFMGASRIFRGLQARIGYANMEPVVWSDGDEIIDRLWLIWVNDKGIDEMIKTPPSELRIRDKKRAAA